MAYKVINFFTDKQDNRHSYNVGDIFPRQGMTVTEERTRELSTSDNRLGKPLIEKIEDDFSQYMEPPIEDKSELPFVALPQGATYTKTEINRMPTSELKALAKSKGIKNAENTTGAELKKALIEKLGL